MPPAEAVRTMTAVDAPVTGPTEGPLTFEELRLAGRNHSLPLEALRYDVTPAGLHYVLVHFDIPEADAAVWSVQVGGCVRRPLELTLEDIRAHPAVDLA